MSGKSFIPLLSSVACAVPGVMATRVIENRSDRLATILVAPLMSCSARIPVYSLMISLFLPDESSFAQAGVMFAMYMIGFVLAPVVAWVLRKTLLRGDRSLFVMELPAYKVPSLKTVALRVFDAGWMFLKRAGTVIFASMVVIWALQYFPNTTAAGENYEGLVAAAEGGDDAAEVKRLKAEWQENSALGRTGHALEPAFAPLGWDWKIGMATLASFPAREVIVGTLRILYQADDAEDGKPDPLGTEIGKELDEDAERKKYRVPIALSVMVFFALCAQCASTLAVIRRETRSWRWPLFSFTYMTVLAYLGALVTYQVGKLVVGVMS